MIEQDKKPKRGLSALLGTEIKLDGKKVNVLSVEVDKIKFSRYQPRTVTNDEKLEELKRVNNFSRNNSTADRPKNSR